MIDQNCIENVNVSKIKIEDFSRRAVFVNVNREVYVKIRVDGCAISHGIRADWAIELGNSAVIVELKGKNVEEAANQIFATAHHWKITEARCQSIAGLIVGRSCPKANTRMQIKKELFAKKFGGPLHLVCTAHPAGSRDTSGRCAARTPCGRGSSAPGWKAPPT